MRKMRNTYKILIRKSEGKRPLERPGRKLEDNIRVDIKQIGWVDVNSDDIGYGPVAGFCEHCNEP
jgi:hypothetical protein